MKYVLIICALVALGYVLFETVRITRLVRVSSKLVEQARGYQSDTGQLHMLVLGDSTAVGVGSDSKDTVAGRMSAALNTSVENYAVSGAKTRDVLDQISSAQKQRYDIVLIQVGANDIIRFSTIGRLKRDISSVLDEASTLSDHVVLITAGKVGKAPFFPKALGWVWTMRANTVRTHFMTAAQQENAAYVDLYSAKDNFNSDPDRYYAPDGLHLTADGYEFWYQEMLKTIQSKWPEIAYEQDGN